MFHYYITIKYLFFSSSFLQKKFLIIEFSHNLKIYKNSHLDEIELLSYQIRNCEIIIE